MNIFGTIVGMWTGSVGETPSSPLGCCEWIEKIVQMLASQIRGSAHNAEGTAWTKAWKWKAAYWGCVYQCVSTSCLVSSEYKERERLAASYETKERNRRVMMTVFLWW